MISTAIVICSVDPTILLDLLFCAKTNPPNKATIGEQKIAPQYQKSKSISYLHASRRRIHYLLMIDYSQSWITRTQPTWPLMVSNQVDMIHPVGIFFN